MINPYNFVPLGNGPDRNSGYPDRYRIREQQLNGTLVCELKVLSPLISLDQRVSDKVNGFKFLCDCDNNPIIQGTSIKGMIRSVYEAMTDSCLPLATIQGWSGHGDESMPFEYANLESYQHCKCNDLDHLCPACRLFGVINDKIHCQGWLIFSDAILLEGNLQRGSFALKVLSSPKPHHYATYGRLLSTSGVPRQIAGRKFYYHHQNPVFQIPNPSRYSTTIKEYASKGTKFEFSVFFDNLTQEELCYLVVAIQLKNGLAHKLGLGKPIGMGSCSITIKKTDSAITGSSDRYRSWQQKAEKIDIDKLNLEEIKLSQPLIEVLRLNKSDDGEIVYPDKELYPSRPIDALGIFGGNATLGGLPSESTTLLDKSDPPLNEVAIWIDNVIKEIMKRDKHCCSEEDALCKRDLAQRWECLDDTDFRTSIYREIIKRWEKIGLWDRPVSGGSMKASKKIYEKYLHLLL